MVAGLVVCIAYALSSMAMEQHKRLRLGLEPVVFESDSEGSKFRIKHKMNVVDAVEIKGEKAWQPAKSCGERQTALIRRCPNGETRPTLNGFRGKV